MCGNNFKGMISQLDSQNNSLGASCNIALSGMLENLTDEKSTLLQVSAVVPSGNKSLLKPMLTQISIWCHSDLI